MRSIYNTIAESFSGELSASTSLNECKSELDKVYGIGESAIEEMDVEMQMSPEMVPVLHSKFTNENYVDMVDLSRVADWYNCEIEEALSMVANVNGLVLEEITVLVESKESMMNALNEAKKSNKVLGAVNSVLADIKKLKNKGIKCKGKKCKK